jgi:hypothetical protein
MFLAKSSRISFAKGPKFRPQNIKEHKKKFWGAGEIWDRIFAWFVKKGRNGGELFSNFVTKTAKYHLKNWTSKICPNHIASWLDEKIKE